MTAIEQKKHNLITEIVTESREQLLQTIRWLVPTVEDAEDILQDVLSRLWFNIDEIRSFSRFGLSVVTIVFEEKVDVYWARQQVNERLTMVESLIPEGVGKPGMVSPESTR